ncbi:MAG: MFS transporter [Gammaproteobacteria bacterium]|nr:MFS transporter [Gammaproteobacteria bacterium]MDH5501090.1 MFS transporter [Gammaproteobacteria bacterium]
MNRRLAIESPAQVSTRRYVLAVLVVVYTFNFIDRQILAILLPSIKAEFAVNDWVLGFLSGPAFAVFYATLGVPIALLGDRWNRRNLIAIALALWSGMTALSGAALTVTQLALARVGVGIGEAGCSPPAHSMISDYYPPEKRSAAMGIYTAGISIGIMIAFLAGGWVAQNIGWREAFFIVGIPGLVLALIVRFTIREPDRGMSEGRVDSGERPGIPYVAKFLFRRKSFVHMAVGSGLAAFNGYSVISFFPSFLNRSHGMNVAEIGVYLGLILGIAGAAGFAGGGYFADHVGKTSRRKSLIGVAAATLIAWLCMVPVYIVASPYTALTLFVIPAALSNFYLATTIAQTQGLVGLRMRAVASAILFFILNIIGLGLGPPLAGMLSDALASSFGAESMRYSLLIVTAVISPWSAFHYFIASRHIESDLAQANGANED